MVCGVSLHTVSQDQILRVEMWHLSIFFCDSISDVIIQRHYVTRGYLQSLNQDKNTFHDNRV